MFVRLLMFRVLCGNFLGSLQTRAYNHLSHCYVHGFTHTISCMLQMKSCVHLNGLVFVVHVYFVSCLFVNHLAASIRVVNRWSRAGTEAIPRSIDVRFTHCTVCNAHHNFDSQWKRTYGNCNGYSIYRIELSDSTNVSVS